MELIVPRAHLEEHLLSAESPIFYDGNTDPQERERETLQRMSDEEVVVYFVLLSLSFEAFRIFRDEGPDAALIYLGELECYHDQA